MCTLTLLRQKSGIRIYMNRDEGRGRAPEQEPEFIDQGKQIFGPLDTESGGTWIAHNTAGYWGCLLNGYFESDISEFSGVDGKGNYISRGLILPSLLAEPDPIGASAEIDPRPHQSFRLLVGNANHFVLWQWDGQEFREGKFHAEFKTSGYFLTSSSWNQNQVIRARAELFSKWASDQNTELEYQTDIPGFHFSSLPSPISAPLMFRSNSCTKSITSLWAQQRHCEMSYQPVAWRECA